MMNFQEQILKARKRRVPLVAVNTGDSFETVSAIKKTVPDNIPLISWDIIQGVGMKLENDSGEYYLSGSDASNQTGKDYILSTILEEREASLFVGDNGIIELLDFLRRGTPAREIVLCVHNAHKLLPAIGMIQAVLNLRDFFKKTNATLILLGQAFTLPSELQSDVFCLSDNFPTADEIKEKLVSLYDAQRKKYAEMPELSPSDIDRAVGSLAGLEKFSIEQALSLSIEKTGIDFESLGAKKREIINQTQGLSLYDLSKSIRMGGYNNFRNYTRRVINGPRKYRLIWFIDEIDKIFTTSSQYDTSNVSQAFNGAWLRFTGDNNISGILLVGAPGAGKTSGIASIAQETGLPMIAMNPDAMKGSLVGQSEQAFNRSFQVLDSTSQGEILLVATCNSESELSAEQKRRFSLGTFFFDLPNEEEQEPIWAIWLEQYGFALDAERPDCKGWTGDEIRRCCEIAYTLQCSLPEAANFISPICRVSADVIERLRTSAEKAGYISASYSGVYRKPGKLASNVKQSENESRDLDLDNESKPQVIVLTSPPVPATPSSAPKKSGKIGF